MNRPGPNWFNSDYAEQAFTRNLARFAGQPNLRFLQVGAYCGDASTWLLDTILTGPGSHLVDVDTWQGSAEAAHDSIDFTGVLKFYMSRVHGRPVRTFIGTSDAFFAAPHEPFDFIYIDGSHETEQVLRDAVNADRYLKVGGLLAFDDYRWGGGARNVPAPAIDAFLRCFEQRYEVIEIGLQVWVHRIR